MKKHMTSILIAAAALWVIAGSAHAHTYQVPSGSKAFGHCAKGPCTKRADWRVGRPAKIGRHEGKAVPFALRGRSRHPYEVARN